MSRMGDPENPSDDEYGISRVKIKKRPHKWRPKSREETPKKGVYEQRAHTHRSRDKKGIISDLNQMFYIRLDWNRA